MEDGGAACPAPWKRSVDAALVDAAVHPRLRQQAAVGGAVGGADGDAEALWAKYFDARQDVALADGSTFRAYSAGSAGPHVVLLHGGGYTAMTWCLVTALLKQQLTIHAFDLRGHGKTKTADDSDLSMDTLVEDAIGVMEQVLPASLPGDDKVQAILVGHSLGGALAVRVAATNRVASIVGVMVIDVVEGTAMASLGHMHAILNKRPQRFRSHKDAIHWALHSGTVRNADAAHVSIPSQLRALEDGSFAWRTDLASSAPYWEDWFIGLSDQFLGLSAAKILVLAGSDRLDTALMRGQMMGKFELRLMYGSGHVVQEDCPEQVATAILEFCGRCARMVGGIIFGPQGAAKQPSNAILAERLAKARAMIPKHE